MSDIKQIVVGVDGSHCSYRALRWAHAEAMEHDAELVVVTTWRPQNHFASHSWRHIVAETDVHPKKLAEDVLPGALATLTEKRHPARFGMT